MEVDADETQQYSTVESPPRKGQPCRPVRYRLPLITSKAAILLLVWNGLVVAGSTFLYSATNYTLQLVSAGSVSSIVLSVTSPSFIKILSPLFGWFADAWLGRFKVLVGSLVVLVMATLLQVAYVIVYKLQADTIALEVLVYFVAALTSIGRVSFLANIIQYVTDHLIGGSGDMLSFTVYWVIWSTFSTIEVTNILFCFLYESIVTYLIVLLVGAIVFLLLALISICVTKHMLNTNPQTTNPIKHITKVLRYACQHKTPVNRSALTYWEEEYPSRIDIGKDKYGGPFTEEEVEDVKTTLWLLPVIMFAATSAIGVTTVKVEKVLEPIDIGTCFIYDLASPLLTLLIPAFYFVVFPLMYNCIPSMLQRIGGGLLFMAAGLFSSAVIDITGTIDLVDNSTTCAFVSNSTLPISVLWSIVPSLCFTLGEFLATITLLEFVLAQSPFQMKGLMIGLVLGFNGIFVSAGNGMVTLLPTYFPTHTFPGCGFWLFSILGGFITIGFVFFLITSKKYKLRCRNNPYNTYAITADHYIRYIDQEKEYEQKQEKEEEMPQPYVSEDSFQLLFHKVL